MKRLALVLLILGYASIASAQPKPVAYPATATIDHIDDYFGVKVPDPYRWLENVDSTEVTQWVEKQNEVTFDYLSKIPFRDKIRQRIEKIWNYPRYSQPSRSETSFSTTRTTGCRTRASSMFRMV